ncbi:MAG TPA: dienelactone hydrolase family protein [Candidatus Tumulicola sp.]|jgi:carboxymethylenebutenolidase
MARLEVTIETRDGQCPAYLYSPDGSRGPWPAVLFLMDGGGIRPALREMAQHLADGGYLVLLPDLYYREGKYPPMVPAQVFADPVQVAELRRLIGTLDRERKVSDAEAFINFLSSRPEVEGERFGVTGYCLGGNIALTAAGAFGDRFAAIASFHGGNLATDKPDSPHLFVGNIEGRAYVACAVEDSSFPPEQHERLERALTDAGVPHLIETYAGAHHGFAVPDMPAFDPAAAQRHWTALFELLGQTLPASGGAAGD